MHNFLVVEGGISLKGTIKISGSKNAALALIPAAILARKEIILKNVPNIEDVRIMLEILHTLNVEYSFKEDILIINSENIINRELSDEKINQLRASSYFMGVLLSIFQQVSIIAPGGCKIGARPIDYHLNAFEKLGAKVQCQDNIYLINAPRLHCNIISLPFPSVGATVNLLLATFAIQGLTIIENSALEPEVEEVIKFINQIGGNIQRIGSRKILIRGCNETKKTEYTIMNDRIEGGTYAIIGALIGENLRIEGISYEHLIPLINVFKKLGVDYCHEDDVLIMNKSESLNSVNIKTLPYPFFPTDLQQPLSVLLSRCLKESSIEDTIYGQRNAHLSELNKMNMKVYQQESKIIINHSPNLIAGEIEGKDLRGSAALICAALIANGTSRVGGYQYLKRGYPNIVEKLKNVGAKIYEEKI